MRASARDSESLLVERIPVTVSEHHVHLTQDTIEQLFCDKYRLHEESRIAEHTQFAARESVTLVGPRGRIANVRVIGPARGENQVEISGVDAHVLGIDAPARQPGDLRNTPGICIEGPRSCVRLDHGVIRTLRHIHMHSADAERRGLRDGDRIDVSGEDEQGCTLFRDVPVRVSPAFQSELHLDADDGKAAGLSSGAFVAIKVKA